MDLVARGVVNSRVISITGELVELNELNELFTDYWRSIVPVTRTSSIAFPFSRLHREPFWKLVPLPGRLLTLTGWNILGPRDRELWPGQVHLEWHRPEFRL